MFKVSVIVPCYNQEELVIKALDSIPKRNDVQIIVIDDGSTDNSWTSIRAWYVRNFGSNATIINFSENVGVAAAVNKGYDEADGEYVVCLGSDDYFYPKVFEKCMEELDGTDLVYFDMEVNNGDIWDINEKSKLLLCGSVKFIRREFLGDTRCPINKITGEDRPFNEELLRKNPTEKYTHLVVKHYNHPREGSLTDRVRKGELSD